MNSWALISVGLSNPTLHSTGARTSSAQFLCGGIAKGDGHVVSNTHKRIVSAVGWNNNGIAVDSVAGNITIGHIAKIHLQGNTVGTGVNSDFVSVPHYICNGT